MAYGLKRSWISPLMAVAFFLLGVTGLLMLMHTNNHAIHGLHEVFGVIFIIAGILHLMLNWSVFLSYFRTRSGAVIALATLLLSSIFLFGSPGDDGQIHGYGDGRRGASHGYRHNR